MRKIFMNRCSLINNILVCNTLSILRGPSIPLVYICRRGLLSGSPTSQSFLFIYKLVGDLGINKHGLLLTGMACAQDAISACLDLSLQTPALWQKSAIFPFVSATPGGHFSSMKNVLETYLAGFQSRFRLQYKSISLNPLFCN